MASTPSVPRYTSIQGSSSNDAIAKKSGAATTVSHQSTVKSAINSIQRKTGSTNNLKKRTKTIQKNDGTRKRRKTRRKRYMPPIGKSNTSNSALVSSRSGLKRLKGRLSSQIRRGFPKPTALPFFKELPETWAHFLEQYGKCACDLSEIERPMCFNGYGFMPSPEAYNESRRTAATKRYLSKRKWNDHIFFEKLMVPFIEQFNVSGLSISLLDRTKQIVKYQAGLAMDLVARNVSIDGHALLSKDYLAILDASADWRMIYNPLVHGPPFIKFYVGVPLLTKDNHRIGVVAAFDPYARNAIPQKLVGKLQQVSSEIIEYMDIPPSVLSPRIESAEDEGYNSKNVAFDRNPDEMYGHELGSFGQDGMPGLLPHNFDIKHDMNSLKRLNCNPQLKQSYQIYRELAQCLNAKAAVERACKMLGEALGLNFVYVIEIRISSSYKVPSEQFTYSSGTACKEIPGLEELLGPEIDRNVHIRLLGGSGISDEDIKFDEDIHSFALNSQYGVQYDAPDEKVSYRSGIFMPFQKSESRVVYAKHTSPQKTKKCHENSNSIAGVLQNSSQSVINVVSPPPESQQPLKGKLSSPSPEGNSSSDNKPEDIFNKFAKLSLKNTNSGGGYFRCQKKQCLVKTRHGGYIMAGYSIPHRLFSPGDIEYTNLCVKGLHNIFACN